MPDSLSSVCPEKSYSETSACNVMKIWHTANYHSSSASH